MQDVRKGKQAGRGPTIVFWLWLTVTFGGLAAMMAIVIGGR
ncbi:hypothetical protein Q9R19_11720 [Microbacterium sp. ARD32]|nr:hypothetical protein [Microbacterium sp. ARD32]MDT0158296.1 hypothetical protein [Microbacterium sp. ARD32]